MSHFSHYETGAPLILTVPGLGGSGPGHWQSLWEEARTDTIRVELGMWDRPHRNLWVTRLDQAIRRARGPVVLAAHSLGCATVAWWAALAGQAFGRPVAGALLVAPADVDRHATRAGIAGFGPVPGFPLPFPSIVVASSDDPWVSLPRAHEYARAWGSHFVNAGPVGHINAESGLGWWQEGQELLHRVLDSAPPAERPSTPASARRAIRADRRRTIAPEPPLS